MSVLFEYLTNSMPKSLSVRCRKFSLLVDALSGLHQKAIDGGRLRHLRVYNLIRG